MMSNQPVPLRGQLVKIELLNAASQVLAVTNNVMTDATTGLATVADNAGATQVRVTDPYGNIATVPLL